VTKHLKDRGPSVVSGPESCHPHTRHATMVGAIVPLVIQCEKGDVSDSAAGTFRLSFGIVTQGFEFDRKSRSQSGLFDLLRVFSHIAGRCCDCRKGVCPIRCSTVSIHASLVGRVVAGSSRLITGLTPFSRSIDVPLTLAQGAMRYAGKHALGGVA
jgi:hypothetical protein